MTINIKDLIPQREPFLFIDTVEEVTQEYVVTTKTFLDSEDFFRGHFPGEPVVPGVILTEHCFQSGAAFISSTTSGDMAGKLAVVSRIGGAKFKTILKPNQKITTKTKLVEAIANAAFFKSIVTNEEGKKVLIIEFACALVDKQN
jgi:3-hydroxyacyl-[acyl-carrier-protein] dehydratase